MDFWKSCRWIFDQLLHDSVCVCVCLCVCVCVRLSVYVYPCIPRTTHVACPWKINNLGAFTSSHHKLTACCVQVIQGNTHTHTHAHGYGYILQTWMIWLITMAKSVPHTDRTRKREVQIAGSSLHMFLTLSLYIAQEEEEKNPHHIHMLLCHELFSP